LTPEYNTWCEIIRRTENENCEAFKNYGGRGIAMCSAWRSSYAEFLKDVGMKPSPKHSIERIDNNKGYEPGNCKWATINEQCRNKRNNINVTHDGNTMCIADWERFLGVKKNWFMNRYKKGWSVQDAIKKLKTQ
jgi:hypothetical protein